MHENIIYFISFICLSFAQEIQIYKNELSDEMKKYAIGQSLLFLDESNSNEIVAKKLVNEMNVKYGGNWFSYIGIYDNNSGFGIEYQKNSFIWFSYKQNHIVLFEPQMNAVNNPIVEAKKDDAKVTLTYVDVEQKIIIDIINSTKAALKSFNDYRDIGLNISKTLELSTGLEWRVDIDNIGFDVNQNFYKNIAIKGWLLSFKIETIEFVIYRYSRSNTNENEVNI